MKKKIILLIIIICLPLAVFFLNKNLSNNRHIASESSYTEPGTNDKDLSEASPQEFKKSFKYQVLKNAALTPSSQGSTLALGLFLMRNSLGTKVFVCDEYPTIDLYFTADGMAFSGEAPQIILRTPCIVSANQEFIETPSIPWSEIRQKFSTQYEFTVDIPDSSEKAKIYLRNMKEIYPEEWTWTGLKFYGKNPQTVLDINSYEIISVLGKPLTIQPTE